MKSYTPRMYLKIDCDLFVYTSTFHWTLSLLRCKHNFGNITGLPYVRYALYMPVPIHRRSA